MKLAIGMKVGKLTIVDIESYSKITISGRKIWRRNIICDCDCGTKKHRVDAANLCKININSGCGCNRGKGIWGVNGIKPHSDIQRSKYFSQPYLTYLKKQARKNHKLVRTFTLTLHDLDSIYEQQDGLCYYTGSKLILPDVNKSFTTHKKETNISLDRKDSSGNYTIDNVVFCTAESNMCKQRLSVDRFIEMCKEVALHHSN